MYLYLDLGDESMRATVPSLIVAALVMILVGSGTENTGFMIAGWILLGVAAIQILVRLARRKNDSQP